MKERQTPACGKEDIRAAIERKLCMRFHAPNMENVNTSTRMIIIKELTLVMMKIEVKEEGIF